MDNSFFEISPEILALGEKGKCPFWPYNNNEKVDFILLFGKLLVQPHLSHAPGTYGSLSI